MFLARVAATSILLFFSSWVSWAQGASLPYDISLHSPPLDFIPVNDSDSNSQLLRRDISDEERQRLDILQEVWRGIHWEIAYPGATSQEDDGGCTVCMDSC